MEDEPRSADSGSQNDPGALPTADLPAERADEVKGGFLGKLIIKAGTSAGTATTSTPK